METAIRPAGLPRTGEYVLQWRSPSMSAPAFWYFDSEEKAQAARARMMTRTSSQEDIDGWE